MKSQIAKRFNINLTKREVEAIEHIKEHNKRSTYRPDHYMDVGRHKGEGVEYLDKANESDIIRAAIVFFERYGVFYEFGELDEAIEYYHEKKLAEEPEINEDLPF